MPEPPVPPPEPPLPVLDPPLPPVLVGGRVVEPLSLLQPPRSTRATTARRFGTHLNAMGLLLATYVSDREDDEQSDVRKTTRSVSVTTIEANSSRFQARNPA
jgi:hypothetical protein